uniref:Uncharacterized protein n=1 Tax=Tanacetum cinerariifolium TaxID=118510 RepID=A0A6L2JN21_TANCI|nr:hypothetical protein [Tanacetum cinerariifolium]
MIRRMHPNRGEIAELDADEHVTLVDVDVDIQRRMEEDVTVVKDINDVEPTVFHDKDVTMTMAQTLIKLKAKKARLLDEPMAKRLQDEEIVQVAMQEKHLNNIKKYQSLKRKPISIAQARRNMVVYLKNIAGYKIQHFKGMTYGQVRTIFEREYNKVQTFLNSDRNEKPTKKRVAKETLLQESFKRIREEVEVLCSHSTQQEETPIVDLAKISEEDVQNMLQIVPMAEFKVEALQMMYSGSFKDTRTIQLCGSCILKVEYIKYLQQQEEDTEVARDLVMKIFLKANQPKSKSLDHPPTDQAELVLLVQINVVREKDAAAEEIKKLL